MDIELQKLAFACFLYYFLKLEILRYGYIEMTLIKNGFF